jgi:hypothetical protein
MSTETQEIPSILRTPKDGCFQFYEGGWGTYLRPIDDPDANVIITKDDLNKFDLKENIHKIPADLWQRWVQLCFHYVEKVASNLEVSVRILRSEENPSKYRIVVPEQKVTAASVRADNFDIAVDIETGEPIESYPPVGWIPVGSSHSHNTMPSFFSGTDDKYELTDPGIHLVVGSINKQTRKYTIASSVVAGGRRFIVNYNDLIDATPVEDVTFHEKVLDFVEYETPVYHKNKTKTYSYQNTGWQQKTTHKKNTSTQFKDPFHYSEGDDFDSFEAFWQYQESQKQDIKLHQVEDILEDYIKQKKGDTSALLDLMSSLLITVDELEDQVTITT